VRADVQELWWRIAIVSVVVLVAAVVTIRRRNTVVGGGVHLIHVRNVRRCVA